MRNVRVDEDDEPYRKSSTATIRSEGTGTQYYTKHGGIQPMYDSSDTGSLDSFRSTSSQMKIRRVSSSFDGSIRFPKLQECAHFHYDIVELPDLQLCLCDEEQENYHHNGDEVMERTFLVKVTCCQKSWNVKRTFKNFRMLDRQLHKCIFDRRFSRLQDLQKEEMARSTYQEMETVLQSYMGKLSELAGSNINCGSILNWFELDNRGNRLLVVDDSGINTPAIAAAHAIKRYTAKAVDEISLEVGDIVSVIDMPSPEDTLWWRGKRGFEVGFFPSECVEVIGDKVPVSMQTHVPLSSNIVRKHGKFLSFLRMFFSTRPARVQLKQSGIVKERVFGCDLGEHLLNSGHDVPLVLKSCSEIIEEYGIVDGIYRLSGITSNIQKIRHAFDEDRVPDLTEEIYLQDIHSISSLLKMYFRELPNPLLTYQLYDKFADAVRDEDNKLWKIHDVVQQLPPPHYRTTEYLMRHLAKVAAFGSETGMHSKNLAIVWAPNLLRSKELECGGGAAALQGVGIQAVVTECLILYADLIFSDKMPSYSSPEMRQSRKKPRPKSLAISTPTKLITLEEARERALSASLRPPSQKFIDVGGGPKNLPDRYHTVIDLPGYRKKVPLKDVGNLKGKKSPSGWRSLFSKSNRHGSVKHKTLKGSAPDSLSQLDRRAITEEDVHNWKRRRLRGAKSAESLINLPASNRESNRMSRLIDDNLFMKMYTDEKPTRHKRSLSSESPRNFHHSESSAMYPSFIMAGSREVAIDVDTSMPLDDSSNSNSDSPEVIAKKKQSFVRNETKRRVVTQRKVPSAPSTPRQDTEHREKSRSPKISKKKSSLLTNDSKEIKILKQDIVPNATDSEKFILRMEDTNLLKPKDPNSKGASPNKDEGSRVKGIKTPPSGRRDSKTSPRVRRKSGDTKTAGEKTSHKLNDSDICKKKKVMTIDLPESPGAKRKNWIGSSGSTPATTPDDPQYYFSRNHDYAEILSDSEESQKKLSNHALCVHDNVDASRLSDSYDNLDPMFFLPHSPPTENVTCDYQSEECQNESQYAKILRKTSASFDEARSKENAATNQISKCLSVPSDIQKSLENMNSGSQTDMLSSVTISELSTSVESFNLPDDTKISQQKRKSASLDSLTEKDSPLTRTLVEINAQIDRAFKSEVDKATQMKQEENEEISSQLSNTQCVIPSQMELSGVYDNFEDMSSCSFSETLLSSNETLEIPSVQDSVSETHFVQDSPKSDLETVETLRLIRAPLKPGQQTTTIVKQNSSDSTISMETIFSSNPLSDTHSVQGSVSKSHSVQDSHSQNFYSENSQIDMIGGMERTTFEKSQYSMYSSHQSSNHGQCGLSSQISRTEQRTSRLMKQNSIEKIVKQDSFSKEDHVCNTPGLLTLACDSTHSPSLDSHLSNHQSSPSSKNQQAAAFAHQSTSSFTPTQNTSSYVTRSDHASSMQVPADHIISPSRSEFSPPQFRDDICSTQSRTESGPVQSHSESGSVQGIGDLTQRTMCYSPTQMKVNKNQTHSDMYSSGNQTQTAKVISPLASPVVVQRRPKSIHRTSMGPISPQSQGQAWPSPSSSPGQTRSNSSQGSSPFMSPTSPQQSRGFDIRRTHSRHGKVTFDLSEEDLHFLSQQGKIQDALLKSDSQMSSTSSSVTSSPESKNRKGKVDPACPVPPAKRDFPHLLLSSTKSCDSNATSSPRSPRQNPRWEDLAGLNQDFRAMAGLNKSNVGQRQEGTCIASKVHQNMDTLQRGRSASDSCVSKMTEETSFERKLQDISNFNEVWRHQLTPTGETCRIGEQIESRCQTGCHVTGSHLLNNTKVTQTNNKEEHVTSQRHQLKKSSTIAAMETAMEFYPSEQSSHGIGSHHSHRERTPECRMEEQTVVIEKPMIKKCLTESDIPHIKHCNIVTQDSLSTTSSSGASDLHIPVSDLQTLASDPQSKELHVQDYQSVSSRMTGKDDSQFKHKTPNMEARAKNLPESGRDVNPKPCKMQKIDSKEIKLNMPMLPPLELSGFPQFENSGLIPTTGASLNNKHEDDYDDPKSKRDSDVTIYENDPLPKDLDISDFGTVENPSPVASKVQGCPTLDTRPTMEEFDLNESCFGIPSHQNLSNELKEKAQEKLKGPGQNQVNYGNLQGIENMPVHRDRALINEYDDTVLLQGPASNTISLQGPVSNTVQGPASRVVHVGIGFQSFNDNIRGLEATLQYTTDQQMEIGATVQYNTDYVDLHLDEDIQMLSQGPMVTAAPFVIDQMEPHNTVSQTVDTTEEAAQNEINADRELSMTLQNSLNPALKGWEYDDVSCSTQFPDQRNPSDFKLVSPAEACLEKVDLSNPDLPELAPPTREFLEVNRPRMIRSRVKPKSIVRPLQTFKVANRETFSDKGENEVLVEHRASFKKKAPVPLPKTKSHSIKPREDFTDQSDINDDVFTDDVKSTITQSRFLRRPCASTTAFVFPNVLPCDSSNRSSLDESVLQLASNRLDDFASDDSDTGKREDIRFTRAHKSAKLQSLKELFEKSCNERSSSEKRKSGSHERGIVLADLIQENQLESSTRVTETLPDLSYQESQLQYDKGSVGYGKSQNTSILDGTNFMQEDLNSPRTRRSISTDVGYEFRSGRADIARGIPMTTAKPPKHRSTSRTRTPSESSTSELDTKSTKSVRQDGSPRSQREGPAARHDGSPRSLREGSSSSKSSPKSQRDYSPLGYMSGDDSPRMRNKTDGSPRGLRHVSFQRTESYEQTSPQSPRSWSTTRSVTIDTMEHPIADRMTQSLQGNLRSRRAVSMETSQQRAADLMSQSLTFSNSNSTERQSEHKGSIKELMNYFESKTEGQMLDGDVATTPSMSSAVQRTRQRVHSVSPTVGLRQMSRSSESLGVINIRHSLELPGSLDAVDAIIRPQPVRIGPKPFYNPQQT